MLETYNLPAASRNVQYLLTCAPNDDSNQSAHSHSLIRIFVVPMKNLCIRGYQKCGQWRFWSDCANAHADLNLRWAHISDGSFPDVAAQLYLLRLKYYSSILNIQYSRHMAWWHFKLLGNPYYKARLLQRTIADCLSIVHSCYLNHWYFKLLLKSK